MSTQKHEFFDEFKNLYKEKVLKVIASMRVKYFDVYHFVFDENAEVREDEVVEAKVTIFLKKPRKDSVKSLRFLFYCIHDGLIIWGDDLDPDPGGLFRGFSRVTLFSGSLEEFRNLDLEELFLNRAKPYHFPHSENRGCLFPGRSLTKLSNHLIGFLMS